MLEYEQLVQKSKELGLQIDANLEKQKILQTQESVVKSKTEYQRHAYTQKLREKLNIVINSRNKANESNKRLLADFDRIQKHLLLMDTKTAGLMAKVNNQKKYLDSTYPNWRERANQFVSPSYLSQESMFNMLDSLRCRLTENDSGSFQAFTPANKAKLSNYKNLASLLDDTKASESNLSKRSPSREVPQAVHPKSPSSKAPRSSSPAKSAGDNRSEPHSALTTGSHDAAHGDIRHAPTVDTLTNITESGDVSLNLPSEEQEDETDNMVSPRPFSAVSLTSQTTTTPDPLQGIITRSTYKPPGGILLEDESSSEGGIENLLNPLQRRQEQPRTPSPARSPEPLLQRRDRNESLDSPGGSVDTVIKSPISIPRKPAVRLSTLKSQVSVETDTEPSAPPSKPASTAPKGANKSALARLNDSSDSEVMLDNKSAKSVDSEDDFDFFD